MGSSSKVESWMPRMWSYKRDLNFWNSFNTTKPEFKYSGLHKILLKLVAKKFNILAEYVTIINCVQNVNNFLQLGHVYSLSRQSTTVTCLLIV